MKPAVTPVKASFWLCRYATFNYPEFFGLKHQVSNTHLAFSSGTPVAVTRNLLNRVTFNIIRGCK